MGSLRCQEEKVASLYTCTSPVPVQHVHIGRPSTTSLHIGERWLVVRSRALGEEIVVVLNKKDLSDAKKTFPSHVIYCMPEVEELHRIKDSSGFAQMLNAVHLVKKEFKGWLAPHDSPIARKINSLRGLCAAAPQEGKHG